MLPFCIKLFLCLAKERSYYGKRKQNKTWRFFAWMSITTDAPAKFIIPFSGSPFFVGALPMSWRATTYSSYFEGLVAMKILISSTQICLKILAIYFSIFHCSWYQRNRQPPGEKTDLWRFPFSERRVLIGRLQTKQSETTKYGNVRQSPAERNRSGGELPDRF